MKKTTTPPPARQRRHWRAWTERENGVLRVGWPAGTPADRIAALLGTGRSRSAVRMQAQKLGLHRPPGCRGKSHADYFKEPCRAVPRHDWPADAPRFEDMDADFLDRHDPGLGGRLPGRVPPCSLSGNGTALAAEW